MTKSLSTPKKEKGEREDNFYRPVIENKGGFGNNPPFLQLIFNRLNTDMYFCNIDGLLRFSGRSGINTWPLSIIYGHPLL